MKRSPVVELLEELARLHGIHLVVEPSGYAARVELPNGRRRYLRGAVFDLNGAGATEIAKDKDYATYFLAKSGFPVPEGRAFCTTRWANLIGSQETSQAAWHYAKTLGFPVVVKPNSKSQGAGVCIANNRNEFRRAFSIAGARDNMVLVQRYYPGSDFRLVALDGKLISAYERLPLTISGDGISSIADLLLRRQTEFDENGRDTQLHFSSPQLMHVLRNRGLSLESVPSSGVTLVLTDTANLSAGGTAIDRTVGLHSDWESLSNRVAQEMALRYVGIDIISKSPLSMPALDYIVLEINAAPGLDHYAAVGDAQEQLVRKLYLRVLNALVSDGSDAVRNAGKSSTS